MAGMGDSMAEFSNNLASDLGPLLALFGESMTIQYLSECTTISDYIIFAAAPIGIITALVSAIRICGGTYLRAFIGRASEGTAAAEVELCTSTGRDVCELFTRGGITRSLGNPSVLELVHLQPRSSASPETETEENTDKVDIYRKYLKRRGGSRWPKKVGETKKSQQEKSLGYWMKKAQRQWKEDPEEGQAMNQSDSEEKKVTNPEPDTDLPNLSLNVGIVRPPRYVFWTIATIGVVLQTGVLVLAAVDPAGLLAETPGEEEGGDERTSVQNALLFIIGTGLMCLGMGCCAALIGRTTREFADLGREPEQERLLWLQPGNQKIGDQSFDCYAIFETRQRPVNRYLISTMDDRRREKMQLYTAVAAATTLVGFIAQFIGIRGISAWVSIAQLIITIIMSLLRGMVRMQRRGKNDNELRHYDHSIHGHELDWLAFNLSCDDCSKARYSQDSEPGSEPQLHRGYSFQVTGKALAAFEIDGKAAGDDDEEEPNGDDHFERASFGSYEPVVEDPDKTWDIMSGQYCCFAGPGDGNPYDAAAKRPAEDFRGYETDGHADSQQECTSEAGAPVESLAGSEDGSEAIAQRGRISDIETPTGEEAHNGSQSNEISGAEQALPVDKKLRVSVEKMGEHTVAKGSKPNHAVPDPKAVFETRVRLANLTGNIPTSICQLGLDQHQSWDPELVRSRHKAGQIARAVCDAAAVLFSDARQRKSLRLQVGIGELGGGSSRAHQIVSVDLEKPSGSTSMGWSIDTAAIEALLGLWLWSIIEPTSHLPESHRAMGYNEVNLPSRSARIVSTGDGEEHWCRRTYVEGELRLLLGSNAPKLQTAKARIDPESDYGLVAMWPAAETKAGGAAVWQKVMPPDSRPPQGKRFFGWQRADSPLRKPEVEEDRAYSIQYVDTDASVLDICAQEIYAALITSMASSQNCSALNLTLHGRGTERQLASDSFTTLRTAFVEQGLGTTADAVLCLLSALREKLRIRPSEENVADIVRECLETRDYRQMEAPLRWACLSFEEEHLNRVIRATAEMYRGAMRKNPDFGIEGILWLASKGPSSLRGEGGMLTVYEAAVKQFREQGRGRLWSGELLKAIRGSPSSWSTPPPDDHGLAALYLLCGYRTIPYVDTFNYDAQRDLGKCLETALWKALKRPSSVWSSIALAVAQVAIKTGLVQTLSTLIFQRTMLCSAVELGDYDLVNLFLENGANNGVQSDDNKEKALLPAARREDTLMIHLLLPFGEDKEKEVLAYKQLLFASAEDGDVDGLRTAIAAYKHRNLDLDEKNQNGQTALSLAAKNGNPGCVTELLSLNTKGPILVNPTSQDNTQLTPMLWAAKSCPRFETDEEILGRRWENTSEPGYLEYNRAAYEEREAQYHDVVDAIYRAYGSEGSHEIFDSQQRTPLSWAAFNGSARLTRWICTMYEVDRNALDIRSRTPLSLAVENKHTHIVEFLLGQEACKPNLPDSRGQTPLHLAIANGSKDIVRILLERWDVDPNLRDLEGTTPLGLAASNGWSEYAEMLLARKDVMASRTDSFGRTPLILAAQNNKKEVVELLLQHYSEEGLNVQDNLGWTALCYAIYLGYGEIVKMLVRDERVFVPEPGTGKWDGGNLCGFAPGKTLKLLVKLGVWQTGEEDDGVQYWEKLEVRQPIAETESDGDDSEFEVEAEDTGEYEATTADDADPEAGIEFGEDGKFEVEEAVGDAELGDVAGEGFQPEDGAADDSEPVFNDESAQSEA